MTVDLTAPGYPRSLPSACGSDEDSAWMKIMQAVTYIRDIEAKGTLPGTLRIELTPACIEVRWRHYNERIRRSVSYKGMEMSKHNPLISAIDEIIKAFEFLKSPGGQQSKRLIIKRR